jgi:hypothetical protein
MRQSNFIGYIMCLMIVVNILSCHNQDTPEPFASNLTNDNININEAKEWFGEHEISKNSVIPIEVTSENSVRSNNTHGKDFPKNPAWDDAVQKKFEGRDIVVVPLQESDLHSIPRNRYTGSPKQKLNKREDELNWAMLSSLIVSKKKGVVVSEVVTILPDDGFYSQPSKRRSKKFSGLIYISDLDGNYLKGYQYKDGKAIGTIFLNEVPNRSARVQKYCIVGWIDHYYYGSGGGQIFGPTYSYSEPIYGWVEDNYADNGGDYLSSVGWGGVGGNSGSSSQGFYFPGNYNPQIDDLFDYTKCFFPASNTTRRFEMTIYVDQPGDSHAGSSNIKGDVGHVFVGFKSIDQNTGEVIERIFGFYPSESRDAILGTSPRINNDGDHPYDVSITFTLTPAEMSQAAQAALTNGSSPYVLIESNCTNFAEAVCDGAGFLLPNSSKKVWLGDSWGFIHSPGILGKRLRDAKSNDPSLPIQVPPSPRNAPRNSGGC